VGVRADFGRHSIDGADERSPVPERSIAALDTAIALDTYTIRRLAVT